MLRLKESTKWYCACIELVHVRSSTFENTSKAVRETEQNKESLVYRLVYLMWSLFLSTYRKEREKQAIKGRGCGLTVCKGEDGVNAGVELCQSVQ